MKYKVFASQLEAYVGQSPARGGKAIKTDRKNVNNLNQLISRVKTIFGRKATTAASTPLKAESPTDLSVVSDPLLKAALADIEKYLAFAFDKTESDNPRFVKVNGLPLAQQEPDITCIRLY